MKNAILTILLLSPFLVFSNNIQVSNVAIDSQNDVDDYYMISMDISWSNSWRTSTYESNWDAAWIFIKYTIRNQQDWQHAYLHYVDGTNDGHIAPAGCTINTANNTYGDTDRGIGVFVYRSGDGIGNVSFEDIMLRWDYGESGLADDDVIEISVNAIEMVYIPEGEFSLGDGEGDFGQFEAGNSGNPFLVSSENALTLGGNNINNLSNNDGFGMLNQDDFDYSTTQTLPANFPKGFEAFYVMKYEASQGQYAEFLRRLTSVQRAPRSGPHMVDAVDVFKILDGDHWAKAISPWRAIEYLAWIDIATYLDWAGLRPLSELEYEKACRGPMTPINNEYAWGSDSWYILGNYSYLNSGTANETISEGIGVGAGNGNANSSYSGDWNPVRCGIFAASALNKTREETGASYYGGMEMTGNCYEIVLSVGNSQSRDFDGFHGDGFITSSGNASFFLLGDWAFASGVGAGFKRGSISSRYGANANYIDREKYYGIRGSRKAD